MSGQTNVNVNLIPVRNGGNFSQWNMSMNGGSNQGPPYPSIAVAKGTTGSLSFTIVNAQNITFNTTNPMYVQAGMAKPTSGVDGQFHWQLGPNHQGQANTVLTVTDSNQTAGSYNYVMNFVNAPQFDPIIDNGGTSFASYESIWIIAGVAIALIAIYVLVLRPMFRKPGPVE